MKLTRTQGYETSAQLVNMIFTNILSEQEDCLEKTKIKQTQPSSTRVWAEVELANIIFLKQQE